MRKFLQKYNYPHDACEVILKADRELASQLEPLLCEFYNGISENELDVQLREIAALQGVDWRTVLLVYLIRLTENMKKEYEKEHVSDEIYFETVADLRTKMHECHAIDGIWGINDLPWYYLLFHLRIFTFGRMQYFVHEYSGKRVALHDCTVNPGDTVVGIHIPSTGAPFDLNARYDSYARAQAFYKERLGQSPVFYCKSWLLYPENRTMLAENRNVLSFMNDFKIYDSCEARSEDILWRIFGAQAGNAPECLPRATSMQRAVADWLMSGRQLGVGCGVFKFNSSDKRIIR